VSRADARWVTLRDGAYVPCACALATAWRAVVRRPRGHLPPSAADVRWVCTVHHTSFAVGASFQRRAVPLGRSTAPCETPPFALRGLQLCGPAVHLVLSMSVTPSTHVSRHLRRSPPFYKNHLWSDSLATVQVEFRVEEVNGRLRAVDVTGPQGAFVQGAPRRAPRSNFRYGEDDGF
jgi:hypothetical protein